MNVRKPLYFGVCRLRGRRLPRHYRQLVEIDQAGVPVDATRKLLVQLLDHCRQAVPYYAGIMGELGPSYEHDPESYLAHFPILTKDVIRTRFEELKSADLARRKWYLNTSGGSTGEPARFIQDQEYLDRSTAITMLFSRWAGKEVGEPELRVWGSERDIIDGSAGLRASVARMLSNVTYLNAFRMTPDQIRQLAGRLNARPPRLIVAYAQEMTEAAKFLAREGITVRPQTAIMTSAGTLYPFMRKQIESVFQCRVFDRYGSREVGNIACQCSAIGGLHVAPWGNYLEVVDDEGNRVPDGVEGDILLTCLTNYAMPLVRYRIGDRGILSATPCSCGRRGQMLRRVAGRSVDSFRRRDGAVICPGYFVSLLYFKDWIAKFQIIQKSYSHILFRIVRSGLACDQADLDEIMRNSKRLMGEDCVVTFDFVSDIKATRSGKYRYIVSEIQG